MSWFIVETSYEGEKHDPMLMDDRQLIKWLTHEIETQHYSGDGNTIEHLAKYKDGNLIPLTLQSVDEERGENDYLYWSYQLVDAGLRPVTQFTVKIDGRA